MVGTTAASPASTPSTAYRDRIPGQREVGLLPPPPSSPPSSRRRRIRRIEIVNHSQPSSVASDRTRRVSATRGVGSEREAEGGTAGVVVVTAAAMGRVREHGPGPGPKSPGYGLSIEPERWHQNTRMVKSTKSRNRYREKKR